MEHSAHFLTKTSAELWQHYLESNTTSKPHNNPSSNNSSNSASSKSTSKGSSKDKPKSNITDKLGQNDKFTSNERDHCIKEGLCLYCGEKGHIAHDCSKLAAAKAHAAEALATELKADAVDSKKIVRRKGGFRR